MADTSARFRLDGLEPPLFSRPIIEHGSDAVSLAVSDGEGGGPIYLVIDDRPDLPELRGAGAGENKPVNKIGNRRAHGVDVKLPDYKSGGLRVWSGRAVIRNIWDVFFG